MEITYAKFKSAVIEGGKRIITCLQFGAKTAKESYPFGFDSLPHKQNLTAVYLETGNKGEAVIVGYINADRLEELAPGESRLYALGSSGELLGFAWAKNNGELWLNGSDYSAVRFAPLKQGLTNQDQSINQELLKIQTAISSLGGTYVPGTIQTNIDQSESTTIKMK